MWPACLWPACLWPPGQTIPLHPYLNRCGHHLLRQTRSLPDSVDLHRHLKAGCQAGLRIVVPQTACLDRQTLANSRLQFVIGCRQHGVWKAEQSIKRAGKTPQKLTKEVRQAAIRRWPNLPNRPSARHFDGFSDCMAASHPPHLLPTTARCQQLPAGSNNRRLIINGDFFSS